MFEYMILLKKAVSHCKRIQTNDYNTYDHLFCDHWEKNRSNNNNNTAELYNTLLFLSDNR